MFTLEDEVHWIRPDGRVESLVLWRQVDGPRVQLHRSVDGVAVFFESTRWTPEGAAAELSAAHATHDHEQISHEQAVASITGRVGIVVDSCPVADCGARIPIGSGQCEVGHRAARHGAGALTTLSGRRSDWIVMPRGGFR